MPNGKRLWRTEKGGLVEDGHKDAVLLAYGIDDDLNEDDAKLHKVKPAGGHTAKPSGSTTRKPKDKPEPKAAPQRPARKAAEAPAPADPPAEPEVKPEPNPED